MSINICKSIAQIEIYSQFTKKKTPFSQNFKISCDDFESEKMFFLFTSLLLQIIEEFVIQVLSEFLITNYTTSNNDFLEFVI